MDGCEWWIVDRKGDFGTYKMENAIVGVTMAFSLRLERREVEKRIYGVEASAAHGFR